MNEISQLKNFHSNVEKKLFELEKVLISQQVHRKSNIYQDGTGDDNGKSDFVFTILKNRIIDLENQVSKKDTIIDHLTSQLFISKNESPQSDNKKMQKNDALQKDDVDNNNNNTKDNDTYNSRTTYYDKTDDQSTATTATTTNNNRNNKPKVVITGDSLLNGINERGLSKDHRVKIQNYSGGTSETILGEIDKLVSNKPDCLIIHTGTNGITKGINCLNYVKKIVKRVKETSGKTKVVFSGLITRKDKKDLDKKVQDINSRLRNYCSQKNIDFIDNTNIKEEHLGSKKLHLNKRGNSVFANNILRYLGSQS